MVNLALATLASVSTHFVGNKSNEQELILADQPIQLDEFLAEKLKDYFVGKMSTVHELYNFHHASSLDYNEVYNFVNEIMKEPNDLHDMSLQIAQHLYDSCDHPKIKSGELHVCYFNNCVIDNTSVEAVGIFKTEVKSGFLEVNRSEETNFSIDYREGIDLNKFDKGCLVFNANRSEGFDVIIYDSQGKGDEAKYWKEQFLGLKQQNNDYHQTSQALTIAKQFIANQVEEEFEVPKADKIDMLNKSVEYFKTNQEFKKDDFANEVFGNEQVAGSFKMFDQSYRQQNELAVEDEFEISNEAVKKQAKVFKSVLKLDKNFHVYIHGNRKYIEKGVDENTGRKYYKLYYEEEK